MNKFGVVLEAQLHLFDTRVDLTVRYLDDAGERQCDEYLNLKLEEAETLLVDLLEARRFVVWEEPTS